jgi:uncharacterized membrane protein
MELTRRLLDMLPKLFSYLISFAVVGIHWVGHHNLFHFITRADRVLLWLNNLFLLCVGFIPFPATLLGVYGTRRVAVIVYGASLVCTGLTLACIWLYATHGRRLADRELSPLIVTSGLKRILLGPILYVVSVAACFLNVRISLVLYVLVPIIYILPGRDRPALAQAGGDSERGSGLTAPSATHYQWIVLHFCRLCVGTIW